MKIPVKGEQCRKSVSRGWSWGNPKDCLVVAACGNLVQQHLGILSVTMSACKACGQRWAVWDVGQLKCSACCTSEKKGKKGYIGVHGKSAQAGAFSHCFVFLLCYP